jgi:hypothetical protein
MMLYHITKEENVDSILKSGLIPNFKRGIGRIRHNCVFLTDDVEFIIETQIGKKRSSGYVVLTVDITGLGVKRRTFDSRGFLEEYKHEFISHEKIDKDKIALVLELVDKHG